MPEGMSAVFTEGLDRLLPASAVAKPNDSPGKVSSRTELQ